jgi:hypothetical protein
VATLYRRYAAGVIRPYSGVPDFLHSSLRGFRLTRHSDLFRLPSSLGRHALEGGPWSFLQAVRIVQHRRR